jgi:hypothetical protein
LEAAAGKRIGPFGQASKPVGGGIIDVVADAAAGNCRKVGS